VGDRFVDRFGIPPATVDDERHPVNPLHLFVRVQRGVVSRLRSYWFRLLGVEIAGHVWLRRVSIPRQWSDVRLAADVALDDGVTLLCSGAAKRGKLSVGERTYINRFTILMASDHVEVGRDCMIGPHCCITDADHGTNPGERVAAQPMRAEPVRIGDNVWLGANVVVLKGVTIGDGAVIAAGAVVTRDVAPGALAVGVPAKVVRQSTEKAG
jgi:acetyltransferase-like isoleucine patch superfamily enzyme